MSRSVLTLIIRAWHRLVFRWRRAQLYRSEFNLTGQGAAIRVSGSYASANMFSVLGVSVARGRGFRPGDIRPDEITW
jgi:hypothetical protein